MAVNQKRTATMKRLVLMAVVLSVWTPARAFGAASITIDSPKDDDTLRGIVAVTGTFSGSCSINLPDGDGTCDVFLYVDDEDAGEFLSTDGAGSFALEFDSTKWCIKRPVVLRVELGGCVSLDRTQACAPPPGDIAEDEVTVKVCNPDLC